MASGGARPGAGRPRGIRIQLRSKQARFVQEYLIDRNGTQAAIRAGYSPRTAHVIAAELLTKPNIRQEITRREDAHLADLDVSAARIRARLVTIGFGDIGELFEADGTFQPLSSLTPEQRALVTVEMIETPDGRTVRFKVRDHHAQLKALELLARHKAMFPKEEPPQANMQVPTIVKIVNIHHPGPSRGPTDYHHGNGNEDGHAKAVPLAPALPAARGNGH
jgi:phage terminase small subunit